MINANVVKALHNLNMFNLPKYNMTTGVSKPNIDWNTRDSGSLENQENTRSRKKGLAR